jgi:dTDP-4-amino-4,6-dideoxygalactose transaminase
MTDNSSIPILRIPFDHADREQIHESIDEIFDSGYLTQGEFTEEFERKFASFTGVDHAVACSNGTAAIELALRGLSIEGQSVIVPTNTFIATAYAAMHAGNRVIFADSDPETFALDPDDVRARIEEDTAAMIPVHIGGVVTDAMDELRAICEAHNLAFIEDAAHAHGSELDETKAGAFGDAGAFSFYPTKVLTTGEGGIVTTDDDELTTQIRQLRNHGKNPEEANAITHVGNNWRMSEFNAAVGVQQMDGAEERIERRQEIAAFYDEHVPDVPGLEPLELPEGATSSYYKYIVKLDDGIDRTELKERLQAEHNVSLTGEVYETLAHEEPLWEKYTYCGARRDGPERVPACEMWPECGCESRQTDGFEGASEMADSHTCLPTYPDLTQAEHEHVIESLRAVTTEMVGVPR